jgi:hypothetical protein
MTFATVAGLAATAVALKIALKTLFKGVIAVNFVYEYSKLIGFVIASRVIANRLQDRCRKQIDPNAANITDLLAQCGR